MAALLSARALATLAAALSAVALVLSAAAGVDTSDEMWFLQVASRVAGGEMLYRDVFYGSTPLAVWLALPGVTVFGNELLVVKALSAISIGLLAAALAQGSAQAGLSTRSAVLLAAAFAVFAGRLTLSPYVAMAMAGAAWAVVAVAAWHRAPTTRLLLASAALAGVAAASKYTIGLLAFGVAVVVVLSRRPREVKPAAALVVAGLGVVALTLLPVAFSGGLGRFAEYAFAAKGTYVDAGSITYLDALRRALSDLEVAVRSPSGRSLEDATRTVATLLPLLAAGLFAAAWLRGRRTPVLLLCALAALAAVAGAYPRFSTRHLAAGLPGSALLAAFALSVLLARGSRARVAVLALTGAWIAVNLIGGLVPKRSDVSVTDVPHLRGVVVARSDLDAWLADAAVLREAGRSGPLMVISAQAGLLHLLSGVPNPTPFDYPYVTAFGRQGEERTARRVLRGEIPTVCLDPEIPGHFRPLTLERAVRETLRPRRELAACVLYGR